MVVKRHLIMGQCFSVTLSLPLTGMDDEDSDTSPLDGMLDDKLRVVYFKGYLAAVAQAIKWVTFYHYIILYFNFFHINKWSILILCSDYMVNCAINICLLMVPIWVHEHWQREREREKFYYELSFIILLNESITSEFYVHAEIDEQLEIALGEPKTSRRQLHTCMLRTFYQPWHLIDIHWKDVIDGNKHW